MGVIRYQNPECPPLAVIPAVVVESLDEIGRIKDCFIHVTDINTTYYIDDKHRIMTVWSGAIFKDDYSPTAKDYYSQTVYDFENNKGYIFNKEGEYKSYDLS